MGAIKLPHGEAIGGGDVLRTLAVSKIEGLGNVPHDENHRGGFFFKLLIGQLDLAENFFPRAAKPLAGEDVRLRACPRWRTDGVINPLLPRRISWAAWPRSTRH